MPDHSIAAEGPSGIARPGRRPRTVMLLQGLMGPLFRRLGQELIRAGHTVHKINFNGGDRAFWRLPNGIDYRGTLAEWPVFFEGVLRDRVITDVVLFGDCRDHHMPAIRVCREAGVPVHVFEEGYIRPDWVTLELGGVNGHSSLPRDPAWYRETAAVLPPAPPHARVTASFRRRAAEALAYNVADVLTRWYYPGWSNHRPWHPLVEGVGWSRKLLRRKKREASGSAYISHRRAEKPPYFLFPLQLDSDAQVRLHSPFAGIADASPALLPHPVHRSPRGNENIFRMIHGYDVN